MQFNHIKDVKLFLKEVNELSKTNNFFCIGETSISILDNRIPQFFMVISDIEIEDIYKNFEDIYHINIYPFSFSFKYRDELFLLIKIDKRIIREGIKDLFEIINNYPENSLIIPLIFDIKNGVFKNLNNCFSLKDNNYRNSIYINDFRNISKSRYFQYSEKVFEEKYHYSYLSTTDNPLNLWINDIFNRINMSNDNISYKSSIFLISLISNESSILVDMLSKFDFFSYFFPLLEECKSHNQSKDYHPEGTLYDHLILTTKEIESNEIELKMAALLHDIGKIKAINSKNKNNLPKYPNHALISSRIARSYLIKLKDLFPFIHDMVIKTCFLIENHMKIAFLPDIDEIKKEEIMNSVYLKDLLKLLKADIKASSADLNIYKRVLSYIQRKMKQNFIR